MAEKKRQKKNILTEKHEVKVSNDSKSTSLKVMVYFLLKSTHKLPQIPGLYLELKKNSTIIHSIVEGQCQKEDTNLLELNNGIQINPLYCLTIDQDSIDDINCFSDNPLTITLLQHSKVHMSSKTCMSSTRENENADAEKLRKPAISQSKAKPLRTATSSQSSTEKIINNTNNAENNPLRIAEGHIDPLRFVGKTKISLCIDTFLYPLSMNDSHTETSYLSWHIYSSLPILRELSLTNILFITLESLYNCNELQNSDKDPSKLVVCISFLRKEDNENHKQKICSFSLGTLQKIEEQNCNEKWETLKTSCTENCLGIYTRTKMPESLFRNIYKNKYKNIDFSAVSPGDNALVFNSLHRFVLTKEMSRIWEEVAAVAEHEMLIELYYSNTPEDVFLLGSLDISPLLYPKVCDCRFGIEVIPLAKARPQSIAQAKSTKQKPKNKLEAITTAINLPFLILRIALNKCITEHNEEMIINDSILQRPKSPKVSLESFNKFKSVEELQANAYRNFDYHLDTICEKMCQHLSIEKKFISANLLNSVLQIVACDFNHKHPTNTNLEFANLMTIVYNELAKIINEFAGNYDLRKKMKKYCSPQMEKIETHTNIMKDCIEIGPPMCDIGEYILNKIEGECDCEEVNFYIGVFYLELHIFEKSKECIDKLLKNNINHFYGQLMMTYVLYMESSLPLTSCCEGLNKIVDVHPMRKEIWILLYCIHKESLYLPGQFYCQMKYENLEFDKRPTIFTSRWDSYNPDLNLCLPLDSFYPAVRLFSQLGMYKFAELVYSNEVNVASPLEEYRIKSSLLILQNKFDEVRNLQEITAVTKENKWFIYQISGDLAFAQKNIEPALHNYEWIFHDPEMDIYYNWRLQFLRCGYCELGKHNYESAITYFTKCYQIKNNFTSYYGLGICLYKLNRFDEAEHCFGECTKFKLHIPDLWAYLTLVNIKNGNNWCALKSYQFAIMHGESPVSEELAKELNDTLKSENILENCLF